MGEPLGLTKPEGYCWPREPQEQRGAKLAWGAVESGLGRKEVGKAGPGGQGVQGTPTSFHTSSGVTEGLRAGVSGERSPRGWGNSRSLEVRLWGRNATARGHVGREGVGPQHGCRGRMCCWVGEPRACAASLMAQRPHIQAPPNSGRKCCFHRSRGEFSNCSRALSAARPWLESYLMSQ